ncbi:MAG TPA: SUF system Fe-S cluster assembly protein [Turneriella sp.]|nr:SUF system Fe-S cluster assembly protein [Turneriella sp.]
MSATTATEEVIEEIREKVIEQLRTCYDPEIPVNVYDLGLIYGIDVDDQKNVHVDMTLTSPNCPSIEELPEEVKEKIESIDGVGTVNLELVWDPPFHMGMMSDEAKLQLGLM